MTADGFLRGCAIVALFVMAAALAVGAIADSQPPRFTVACFAFSLFVSATCLAGTRG